jgi:pimeloyl-ACP methyl ester carboxylesterase
MTEPLPRIGLADLASQGIHQLDGQSFYVAAGGMDIPCRLKLQPGAERLFVMFNGAVNRKKVKLPAFARWNWGKVLGGHVLAVCDPTLLMSRTLRLGWFLGTAARDPMVGLLQIVEDVERQLKLLPQRVVFYGSSGGGYAAVRAASEREVGRAIGINMQTVVRAYHEAVVDRVARVFDPAQSAAQSSAHYPLRWSVIDAAAQARSLGRDLRLLYVQNLVDEAHHKNHFTPFCERFGLPLSGGTSADGALLSHIYSSPDGHGAEPPEVVKFILSEGLQHLER